jgi:predicted nucleic acid-binding protein
MERFLIDTSSVSDYLSSSLPSKGMRFLDAVVDSTPNISVITQIELLCWNVSDDKYKGIKNFVADCRVFEITPDIIDNCVKVRKGKKIKTPDAIIAATAISLDFTLVTSNTKDFSQIPYLRIFNPMDL